MLPGVFAGSFPPLQCVSGDLRFLTDDQKDQAQKVESSSSWHFQTRSFVHRASSHMFPPTTSSSPTSYPGRVYNVFSNSRTWAVSVSRLRSKWYHVEKMWLLNSFHKTRCSLCVSLFSFKSYSLLLLSYFLGISMQMSKNSSNIQLLLAHSKQEKVPIFIWCSFTRAISFYLPGNSELGIIIFRYVLFMRKAKFKGLSDLVLLLSESRGHGDLLVGPALRATTLSHIALTCLP